MVSNIPKAGLFTLLSLLVFSGPVSGQALDVVLIVDRTGSMDQELGHLRQTAGTWLAQFNRECCVDDPLTRYAVISFAHNAILHHGFTNQIGQVQAALHSIQSGGGIEDGVAGIDMATSLPFAPGSKRIFILFTDDHEPAPWTPAEEQQAIAGIGAVGAELWVHSTSIDPQVVFGSYGSIQVATGGVDDTGSPLYLSGRHGGPPDWLIENLGMIARSVWCEGEFLRGDANQNGFLEIGDPVAALGYLYAGATHDCLDSLDSNDDGALDISDPVHMLLALFGGGASPPAPFPQCGSDVTASDSLGCLRHEHCTPVGPTLYVSTTGDDLNPGTNPALPLRTVRTALSISAATGGAPIRVAEGSYSEPSTLVVPDGCDFRGGFDPTTWAFSGGTSSIVVADRIAISVEYARLPTTIADLTIESAPLSLIDVSAYAVRAVHSDRLTISNCTLIAADAVAGWQGSSPTGTGVPGQNGGLGAPGCENGGTFCDNCGQPSGGAGGLGGGSGSDGGRGGFANDGPAPGLPGLAGVGALGGAGGPGTPSGQGNWSVPPTYWGVDGLPGTPGADGAPGSALFCMGGYFPIRGFEGEYGVGGGGGGGGGGGCGGCHSCDSYGGAGGGGGGGGGGGAYGGGGGSGGISAALYLWGSDPVVESCLLIAGTGGDGGIGGTGQPGGPGGLGGVYPPTNAGSIYGGPSEQDDGSNGGRGGDGGSGGRGGHGGGGLGGASVCIILVGGSDPALIGNTYQPGTAGSGGASPGHSGAAGVQTAVWIP